MVACVIKICAYRGNLFVVVEKIENVDDSDECEEEDFFNFLRFDLKRKINKKDIEWESKCYNIWEPELSEDEGD